MGTLATEILIDFTKQTFQEQLSRLLNITKIEAPLFVSSDSGIQDNLNAIEKPISFSIKEIASLSFEIVQSLAKWKRLVLARYNIEEGTGIYTDMKALRPDEEFLHTDIHSVLVDQWDWEKVIKREDRNLNFLKDTVKTIYKAIRETEKAVCKKTGIKRFLPEDIFFIHSEDLFNLYPNLKSLEREGAICREKRAVFIIGIGSELSDGSIHDGRAPDYDDWTTPTGEGKRGLNGDIIIWSPILERALEISSMGIRVDKEALIKQLEIRECMDRKDYHWHRMLLDGKLPLSIGGGIGQSRLVMLLLQKQHIGEVQVSIWPKDVIESCQDRGISLLE